MFNWSFFIILLVAFVDYLGIGLVYPLFAAILFDPQEAFVPPHASDSYRGAMLGILIAMTPLTQFFVAPVLGGISDLRGRKPSLIFGLLIGCFGYILAILGIYQHSLLLLFFYRVCVGVCEATGAIAQAAVADMSTPETKARRFAILSASFGTGFSIGPYLGGKLSDPLTAAWCNYLTPFLIAGTLSVINLLLVIFKFKETREKSPYQTIDWLQGLKKVQQAFFWRHLRFVFIGGFAFAFGWSFFQEFAPILLKWRYQLSNGKIADYYAITSFWYAISAGILSVPLIKRVSPEKLLTQVILGSAIFMMSFIFISDINQLWWLCLPPLMYFIAIAFPTCTTLVSNRTNPEVQGEALGVYQAIQASAMGLSPLIVGSAVGAYPPLAAIGGSIAMVIAAMAFWMSRKDRPQESMI